ncbi:MAG: ATP-binding cassette domain-containing protein [Silvanigrellaceae bacterium]
MSDNFLIASDLFYKWKSQDLFVRQKDRVLWNINKIEITEPGIILLAGRNGVGKSTLLRCLLGLMKPTRGRIQWFGESTLPRGRIGYLPELPVLPARAKVSEIITSLLGISVADFKKNELEQPVIGSLNISALMDRQAQLLSKGQQQKLLLTLALAGKPSGFVLDEPFSGLDPWARSELAEHLVQLGQQNQFLLISSHDAPNRIRKHVRETWIIENQTLQRTVGCAIPE